MSSILIVAVSLPLRQSFDYLCAEKVAIGVRVKVPFGHKKMVGIVLGHRQKSEFNPLKTVEEVLDKVPILEQKVLDFLFWAVNYYHHPIGEVLLAALPKNLRLGKPAVIKKPAKLPAKIQASNLTMSKAQNAAIKALLLAQDNYHGFLLHGVTGSGKTEVYLRVSQALLLQGKQVLILVPEIGLTPQMISRFESRLKTNIVAIHSQLNESQKLDAYLMAKNNTAGVVLGTRSAIFAPMPNLGLIIIDEEHDGSFKQNSGFRYSARDLSFIRAKQANIPLILGTATPALETLKNVMDGKLSRLVLAERAGCATLPKVSLIDMKSTFDGALSDVLVQKTQQYLQQNKQVMLFINRRGYAPVYFCTECDWKAQCDHCTAKLVYHRSINRLKCHHCGVEKMPENTCPNCKNHSLKVLGYGTQRLAESLASYFPKTLIIRIDRDSTRRKTAFATHLKQINSGAPCIIVGTQMLAKGHDFFNLAMVGVLDIDIGLLSLDFRATEHLAQLLIQVSGRAGRSDEQGEVVIQTRYPQHPIFKYVLSAHYSQFASQLLKQRQQALMPPFSYQAKISANAKNKQNAQDFLQQAADLLANIKINSVEIWGPAAAIIEKKSDYYYFNLYLQSTKRQALHQTLSAFVKHIKHLKFKNKVRWYLDIDPTEA